MERLRRRWAVGTVAAVLGLCLAALALSWLAAPESPTGYGPVAERAIVDACARARGGQGRPACHCAYERLAGSVPWERAVDLDEQLRRGEELPGDVEQLVASCWDGGGGAEGVTSTT
ncbi:MAG: hypothetical protein GEV08_12835 [Acidimicrobiia bacterium]|nr:hypothetical protein [Acidimicrobiia bacterium]